MTEPILAWTDGSCIGNPGPGGIGIVLQIPDEPVRLISSSIGQTTNNRAELTAVQVALRSLWFYKDEKIVVHTDSANVIGWLTGKFNFTANGDLIASLLNLLQDFSHLTFQKVAGHGNDENHNRADRIAAKAARQQK